MRISKTLATLAIAALPFQANAVLMSYDDTQTVTGPINYNGGTPYSVSFTTPTGTPLTDAILKVTSLGDWSYPGGSAVEEAMAVYMDGVQLISNLFQFDAGLDAGSPLKNDNSQAIYQSLIIPQATLASFVGDNSVTVDFYPTTEVNIASQSSYISAQLTYRLDTATVPEPATLSLMALSLAGLGYSRRKKKA